MGGTPFRSRTTRRDDGDFRIDADVDALEARRRGIVDAPWTWLRQVHGARVVTVTAPGEHAGAVADAAVTTVPMAPLAIHTADCAPLMLLGPGAVPVVGVAHVGWRGLLAGVVGATLDAMRALGAGEVAASVGPCVRPGCYEFGDDDLDALEAAFGTDLRATATSGRPALDLVAGVRSALRAAGVPALHEHGGCTACDRRWFSHRGRRDPERMATVAWLTS